MNPHCRMCKNFDRKTNTCFEFNKKLTNGRIRDYANIYLENTDLTVDETIGSIDMVKVSEQIALLLPASMSKKAKNEFKGNVYNYLKDFTKNDLLKIWKSVLLMK